MKHPFFIILAVIYSILYTISFAACIYMGVEKLSKTTFLIFIVAISYLIYYCWF